MSHPPKPSRSLVVISVEVESDDTETMENIAQRFVQQIRHREHMVGGGQGPVRVLGGDALVIPGMTGPEAAEWIRSTKAIIDGARASSSITPEGQHSADAPADDTASDAPLNGAASDRA